ncbi:DUF4255 domain-containing protein [Actinomycetospora chibensis]|uniref:DUF4255 domain-containing protein n=1 Tax=Actinomycetospora chibensis TaxID=663606 RepID=A0ABV9RN28_9PSEU|nr:DUF4255 domain-containing protein [Actinomycetospora chibensis]MDD7926968.1 DUF4255 domain-containing protein [Actinomycetospora chibensis]
MSNALSVSAVTAALRDLLDRAIHDSPPGTSVTTLPPDKARDTQLGNQLNVFLYHIAPDASWRNMAVPGPVRTGIDARPPLPLCLYYMITAYGRDDNEVLGHEVLGRAMSSLHDHPVLGPADFAATDDVRNQRERLRITFQPLTLDEMSNLWTTFPGDYRISAAYEVSVVLIDSTLPSATSLPVLTRGPDDRGADVLGGLESPFPTIDAVAVPDPSGAAALGDVVRLTGHRLGGATKLRLSHPLLAAPHELDVQGGGTDREVSVLLPETAAAALPSGAYTVQLVVPGTLEQTSNSIALALGPRILTVTPSAAAGGLTVTVSTVPRVRVEQRVRLLLADRELLLAPPPEPLDPPLPPGTAVFTGTGVPAGKYLARLSVDGFVSRVVAPGSDPPRFDSTLEVTVP